MKAIHALLDLHTAMQKEGIPPRHLTLKFDTIESWQRFNALLERELMQTVIFSTTSASPTRGFEGRVYGFTYKFEK